jgi:hypothetical protein
MTMPATSGTRPTAPSADVDDDPSIASLMTTDVMTVPAGARVPTALQMLARRAR